MRLFQNTQIKAKIVNKIKVIRLIGPKRLRSFVLLEDRFKIDPKKKKTITNHISTLLTKEGWFIKRFEADETIYTNTHKIPI